MLFQPLQEFQNYMTLNKDHMSLAKRERWCEE